MFWFVPRFFVITATATQNENKKIKKRKQSIDAHYI